MDEREQLLKVLTEAHGVPGYETEIRAVLREAMEPLGTVTQDKLGSLICHQPGDGPKVMLAGHMDEIGFMVSHITKEGFLKFVQLGGWWDQVLLGHRVVIKSHKGDVVGVIGAKPPHLLDAEERNKIVVKKDMYIDIGGSSREDVEAAGVRVGDPVVPQSDFVVLANPKTYLSKAFDNRIGCAMAVEVLRHYAGKQHPNHIYGVTTVMEEVGVRGATTSVRVVDPDVAIILESDIAGDVPGIKEEESNIKLGAGPTIMVYDARMIPNIKLRDLFIDTAAELNVPVQFSALTGGATDGAAIHLHGTGVPTVVIGVAARHIHSHGAIIHRDDFDNAVKLLTAVVAKLDAATVAGLTE
ncbi:MAG: M42 family metallopeptidase [Chloroflexi bacterium]|nr:M42 family metallopeptidase [Chloroflexota bacterium]MCI0580651.1 M42 family metallopeptidase [Chloroflexota bacterium]MCI0648667.1 M42 family metallopeptidase [Chloroflexota bacterium]MCI0728075.1 M42 family metallopeptidase [Chloroflexota bacterium]